MYARNLVLARTERMALDGVGIFLAALLAVWLRHGLTLLGASGHVPWSTYLLPATAIAVLTVIVLRFSGSYQEPGRVAPAPVLLGALGVARIATLTMGFFYRSESYSRATVLIFFPLAALALLGTGYLSARYGDAVRRKTEASRRVLIVGDGTIGHRLARALLHRPAYYELVGFLDDAPSDGERPADMPPILGSVGDLGKAVDGWNVSEVLIAPNGWPPERTADVIGECMRHRVAWKAVPHTFGLSMDRVNLDEIDGIPIVGAHDSPIVGQSWMLKRGFDIVFASVALVLLFPVLLIIAMTIHLTSKGPVLYRQDRVGFRGRTFQLLKFRTMSPGSDSVLHEDHTREWIYGRTGKTTASNASLNGGSEAPLHKMEADPRVTRFGRILRATSLDELPQFWNVLRGEMSVVGPRPALAYEVDRYTEWHKRRLSVPPGITGLWQVSGRDQLSFREMVELDIGYIDHWSLRKDLKIILKTVPVVLTRGGR